MKRFETDGHSEFQEIRNSNQLIFIFVENVLSYGFILNQDCLAKPKNEGSIILLSFKYKKEKAMYHIIHCFGF